MENTTNQLTILKERIARKKQAESILTKTRELLKAEQENLARQTITLKKEYEDVLRLENTSLASVFYSFLGTKEDKLDKEKQEYLSAKLKFDSCQKTVAQLEEEIKRQEKDLIEAGNPEQEYNDLIKSESEQLKSKNDPVFLAISEEMDAVYSKYVEVDEAITAGKSASEALKKAVNSLSKANGWGTFDMLGGGLIATAVKHSHIDDAKLQIQNVQFHLKRFKKELNDVWLAGETKLQPDLNGFDTFADYFFDNLITDWIVQSKINSSYDKCIRIQNDIVGIVDTLIDKKSGYISEYNSQKEKLANYLANQ
jgi:hypothetical protein